MYNKKLLEKMVRDTFGGDYDSAHITKFELPQEYIAQIQKWFENPTGILFFAGNPGLGKTYLCVCLCKYLIEKEKLFRCYNEKSFYSHLRLKINENVDSEYEIKRLCEAEYFILDDIGGEDLTEWQIKQLFSFLDIRSASRFPTIMTSNLFLKDIDSVFSKRFKSRLLDNRNVIIELNWVDKRLAMKNLDPKPKTTNN